MVPRRYGGGKEVGDPDEVPGGGGREGDRMAGIADDADAGRALARGLAGAEPLEEGEVAVPEREAGEKEHRLRPGAEVDTDPREEREQQHAGDEDAEEDRHVDKPGERARPDPRDLEVEHHVLRRLDAEMLAAELVQRGGGNGRHGCESTVFARPRKRAWGLSPPGWRRHVITHAFNLAAPAVRRRAPRRVVRPLPAALPHAGDHSARVHGAAVPDQRVRGRHGAAGLGGNAGSARWSGSC
jgi:hypothetical protein